MFSYEAHRAKCFQEFVYVHICMFELRKTGVLRYRSAGHLCCEAFRDSVKPSCFKRPHESSSGKLELDLETEF